jgi:2-amino-4-hydroxy-6-hydroxymethyldihydropteridine diphosphokinase
MQIWQPAYIGVGSNLADPAQQVRVALERLAGLPRTRRVAVSPLYGSRPLGPVAQPDFVNAAVGLLTQLSASELLEQLRALETAFGRPPQRQRWGPRVLDLDLLSYAQEQRTDTNLTLPHPGIVARNFVLYPLGDIAPDLELPGLGRVTELKGRVTSEGLSLL